MVFVLLCGLPGVGKFTLAQALCAATGFRNFHNHLVVDAVGALFPFGSPAFTDLREAMWLTLLDRALAEASAPGVVFTLAWDRTLADDFPGRLHHLVTARGGGFVAVEATCAAPAHLARLADPARAAHGKLRDPAFYRDLERDGAFPRPALPFDVARLDITDLAPADAAERIRVLMAATHPMQGPTP